MSRPGSWYSEEPRYGNNGYSDDLLPQFAPPSNRQLPLTPAGPGASHPSYYANAAASPSSSHPRHDWSSGSSSSMGGGGGGGGENNITGHLVYHQQQQHQPPPPPPPHSAASSLASLARSASLGGSRRKDPFGNQVDDVERSLNLGFGSEQAVGGRADHRGSWAGAGGGQGGGAGFGGHVNQMPAFGGGRMNIGELYPSSMTGEGLERTGLAAIPPPPSSALDPTSPSHRRVPPSPGSVSAPPTRGSMAPPPPPPSFHQSFQPAPPSSTAASHYSPYTPRTQQQQQQPPPSSQPSQQQQSQLHSPFNSGSSSNPSPSSMNAISPARGPRPPSSRPSSQVEMRTSPLPRPPGAPHTTSYSGRSQHPPLSPSTGSSSYQSYPPPPPQSSSNPYQQHQHHSQPPPPPPIFRSQSSQNTNAKQLYQPPPPPPSLISQPMNSHQNSSSSSSYNNNSSSSSNNPYAARQPSPSADPVGGGSSIGFKRVSDIRELRSSTSSSTRKPDAVSPLKSLTTNLAHTYSQCNPTFRYELSHNPRRVLTKPDKGVLNDGHDNEDNDYILYVNDILGSDPAHRYRILDVLGQGTFGQVVKCQNIKTNEQVAVKVIKNKPAYLNQSKMEVAVLEDLNNVADPHDEHNILRMRTQFMHHSHLCLVFECLSSNLYELIKQNSFRGLSSQLVKVFTAQLLDTLSVLKAQRLIHCDLKPENILLRSLQSPRIKVIDFGSACHEYSTVYTYIQSRFYRSPEVLLGLPYSTAIDMWSLGCIAVELFLGLPLFPGTSEYNQLSRIIDTLGMPPNHLLEHGKQVGEYFNSGPAPDGYGGGRGGRVFRLKPMDQYSKEHNVQEQPSKQYFKTTSLPEMIKTYAPLKKGAKQSEIDKEMAIRESFTDFVLGCLNLDPIKRWSPQQALLHPFITGEKFTGHFSPSGPSQILSKPSRTPQQQQQQQAPPPPADPNRPYGGLVQTPASTRQPVYADAASYNRQLAQHQTHTAQQQAAQAQASAYKHPFAPPPAPTSNDEAAYNHNQRVYQAQQAHAAHVQAQAQASHAARLPSSLSTNSGFLPSPYSNRNSTGAILPPPAAAHPSSSSSSSSTATAAAPPNAYYPPTGRNRANTINQMDVVPAHLARLVNLGVEHLQAGGPGGRSALTPVLNRDEMMQEWERRNAPGGSGKRTSVNQTWPQLEFLEAESLGWGGGQGSSSQRYGAGGYGSGSGAGGGKMMVDTTAGSRSRQSSTAFGSSDVHMGPTPSPGGAGSGGPSISIMTPPQAYTTSSQSARYAQPQYSPNSIAGTSPFDAFDLRHDGLGTLVQPLQPSQAGYQQQQQHRRGSSTGGYDPYGQQQGQQQRQGMSRKQSANTLGEGWR